MTEVWNAAGLRDFRPKLGAQMNERTYVLTCEALRRPPVLS